MSVPRSITCCNERHNLSLSCQVRSIYHADQINATAEIPSLPLYSSSIVPKPHRHHDPSFHFDSQRQGSSVTDVVVFPYFCDEANQSCTMLSSTSCHGFLLVDRVVSGDTRALLPAQFRPLGCMACSNGCPCRLARAGFAVAPAAYVPHLLLPTKIMIVRIASGCEIEQHSLPAFTTLASIFQLHALVRGHTGATRLQRAKNLLRQL